MSLSAIVQKLRNYCNVFQDNGMSCDDYTSVKLRAGIEQLTTAFQCLFAGDL
ncbi:MAG: hypothetical protein K0S79_2394 [Nitrospira sp.]|jgi:hypothetical protein|nr:hypothetical protein [Nitrospira sp.]